MTDEPNDLADFELVLVSADGDEELAAACSGPRESALREILGYWAQFPAESRRVYEISRTLVDLSAIEDAAPSRLILPQGVVQ